MHSIHRLRDLGQSVWLDFLDHDLVASGELRRMIEQDALAGMTSNPTIFRKALAATETYDDLIESAPTRESDASIFERIQVAEVQAACDEFCPLYEATEGGDGYVSIEVSPSLALDTDGSIEEARRLWAAVHRRNLFVKIPGTSEGVPAIEQCLSEGININVTLLFSVSRYLEVVAAYENALETRMKRGEPIDRLASIASFFVSRVDTKVDKMLDRLEGDRRERGHALRGKAAIANAKLAYVEYERRLESERFRRLAAAGARPQRVLWASTSVKDPAYPPLYYAEALIGALTVDTMTLETFRAYRDGGAPEVRLRDGLDEARASIGALASVGIAFDRVTAELEDEGVRLFETSLHEALDSISRKRPGGPPSRRVNLPRAAAHRR